MIGGCDVRRDAWVLSLRHPDLIPNVWHAAHRDPLFTPNNTAVVFQHKCEMINSQDLIMRGLFFAMRTEAAQTDGTEASYCCNGCTDEE